MLLTILLTVSNAGAKVTGVCSNCHTMHNSQNGSTANANGPYGYLLNDTCVGCHSNSDGNATIVNGTPMVLTSTEPTYPPDGSSSSTLAGGNFYWLVNGNGSYDKNTLGHNVVSISGVSQDPNTTDGPPGGFGTSDFNSCGYCHGKGQLGDCTSCHVPRHHTEDHPDNYNNVVDESNGFYRFLGRQWTNTALPSAVYNNIKSFHNNAGVKGIEDSSWEQNPSSTAHNEYAGETSHTSGLSGGYDSISDWCGGCHGEFHYRTNQGAVGNGSPWLRHPTDFKLGDATGTEYIYNTTDGTNFGPYNPLVPIARADIDSYDGSGPSSTVSGDDQVQCLSCHRAHGSPYPDMLRWDYSTCNAGTPNSNCGCFVCHTKKDE